jgi:FkbM family methyltransferase
MVNIMIERLKWLRQNLQMPQDHEQYLKGLDINPQVIYDIGSCTLHWYDMARRIWPNARIICFDAMHGADEFYRQAGVEYYAGFLSDQDQGVTNFWSNRDHPAGNSAYRENPQLSPLSTEIYTNQHQSFKLTRTLDSVMAQHGWPKPDFIKIDVQGSELDIFRGSVKILEHCQTVIAEVQNQPYNMGAPLCDEVTEYLADCNFNMINPRFSGTEIQGDAHYTKCT